MLRFSPDFAIKEQHAERPLSCTVHGPAGRRARMK